MPDSHIHIGGLDLNFQLDENQSSGEMVIFEFTMSPGARVPEPHYHKDVDEFIFGLEGVTTCTVEGKMTEIRPGESIFIPRGQTHHHANLGHKTARTLVVLRPGFIGRSYFEEMAAVLNAPGRPDIAKAKEIMLRHGLVPVMSMQVAA